MTLYTADRPSHRKIEEGELIYVCAVSAANILRDIREMITNTFGGRMSRYEALANQTIARALGCLEDKARENGYDGCVAVRIAHPTIIEGGMEVVVYGTGFNYVKEEATSIKSAGQVARAQ